MNIIRRVNGIRINNGNSIDENVCIFESAENMLMFIFTTIYKGFFR